MIVINNNFVYFMGAFCVFYGLTPFFPEISSKILKKEIKSGKKQKSAGITLIIIGIGLLAVAYSRWLF